MFSKSDKLVWLFVFVVSVVALLLFGGVIKVHAESESSLGYNHDTVSITCIDRNHWQYHNDDKKYCESSASVQPVKKSHKKSHNKQNDTVSSVEPVTPKDNTPKDQPKDNTPKNDTPKDQDKTHQDHGNHYGNPNRTDNNCQDDKNSHDTCNQTESTSFALFVTLILFGKGVIDGKKITMDGVRRVGHETNGNVVITKELESGDIVYYEIPDARIESAFLSESPFHHVQEEVWNQYLRD